MTDTTLDMLSPVSDRAWIRLRTQIVLRWVAIFGQLVAVLVAEYVVRLQIDMGMAYFVIGLSAIANLVANFVFPENKRLSAQESLAMVIFDVIQLSLLLYLTGGLNNPFSMLLLGPVIVATNMTGPKSTAFVGALTILSASILAQAHHPLIDRNGTLLQLPDLFIFGAWSAIVIGVCFIGAYAIRINQEISAMSEGLAATQMALAREQKLTDLGGVVAAAAHELGTPLATIKLTSAELIDELADQPQLLEDARLIRDQADRCRVILRNMGRAGKDDLQLKTAPLTAVVHEAAQPHSERGIEVVFDSAPAPGSAIEQPEIRRRPEVIHGLRNLVQNAVDFADQRVLVETRWSDNHIVLRIVDDGPGFAPHTIGRLGEPFLRARRDPGRPGYDGMGLGLFIAKTLLERTGAELTFANGPGRRMRRARPGGAIVILTWPRSAIEATDHGPLSAENLPIIY